MNTGPGLSNVKVVVDPVGIIFKFQQSSLALEPSMDSKFRRSLSPVVLKGKVLTVPDDVI